MVKERHPNRWGQICHHEFICCVSTGLDLNDSHCDSRYLFLLCMRITNVRSTETTLSHKTRISGHAGSTVFAGFDTTTLKVKPWLRVLEASRHSYYHTYWKPWRAPRTTDQRACTVKSMETVAAWSGAGSRLPGMIKRNISWTFTHPFHFQAAELSMT